MRNCGALVFRLLSCVLTLIHVVIFWARAEAAGAAAAPIAPVHILSRVCHFLLTENIGVHPIRRALLSLESTAEDMLLRWGATWQEIKANEDFVLEVDPAYAGEVAVPRPFVIERRSRATVPEVLASLRQLREAVEMGRRQVEIRSDFRWSSWPIRAFPKRLAQRRLTTYPSGFALAITAGPANVPLYPSSWSLMERAVHPVHPLSFIVDSPVVALHVTLSARNLIPGNGDQPRLVLDLRTLSRALGLSRDMALFEHPMSRFEFRSVVHIHGDGTAELTLINTSPVSRAAFRETAILARKLLSTLRHSNPALLHLPMKR